MDIQSNLEGKLRALDINNISIKSILLGKSLGQINFNLSTSIKKELLRRYPEKNPLSYRGRVGSYKTREFDTENARIRAMGWANSPEYREKEVYLYGNIKFEPVTHYNESEDVFYREFDISSKKDKEKCVVREALEYFILLNSKLKKLQ